MLYFGSNCHIYSTIIAPPKPLNNKSSYLYAFNININPTINAKKSVHLELIKLQFDFFWYGTFHYVIIKSSEYK